MTAAEWSDGAAGPLLSMFAEMTDADAVWQDDALCSQADPDAFFPEKSGSTREAKRVCARCPVRAECLDYAIKHSERWGVWGGLSEQERKRIRRQAAGRAA